MQFAILHDNGTYYQDMVRLGPSMGPRFGAKLAAAKRFKSEMEATRELSKHYGFVGAKVVELDE
jgi:hypothetical protein